MMKILAQSVALAPSFVRDVDITDEARMLATGRFSGLYGHKT
jgi:hypothetical protein